MLSIATGLRSEEDDWAIGAFCRGVARFVEPVLPVTRSIPVSEITEVRRSRSKPDRGIVTLHVVTRNQRDGSVLEGTDVVLVGARGEA